MFEALSDRLQGVFRRLTGQAKLTPENIREGLREVRRALLEADVQVAVARDFVAGVEARAVGEDVLKSLTPGQQVVGIVREELESLLGKTPVALAGSPHLPTVVLLAGLQGSGKTTFAGKLALWLKQRDKRTLLASADVYRPAAIDQLERVAAQAGVGFWRAPEGTPPKEIATLALGEAKRRGFDFFVLDTAGRLHIDDELMDQVARLKEAVAPQETLFVADAMTGQDAVRSAAAFHARLEATGVIFTKTDGDSRGGAALSIVSTIHRPIKFVGTGEKIEDLEPFHPDRMASRILGMGDVLSLIERVEQSIDAEDAARLAKKAGAGEFTLEDLRDQLNSMKKMGPLSQMLDFLPKVGPFRQMPKAAEMDPKGLTRIGAIIDSMTPDERRYPQIVNGSRRKRIARGSGTKVEDVNRLLKQHAQMKKMMKSMKGLTRGMRAQDMKNLSLPTPR